MQLLKGWQDPGSNIGTQALGVGPCLEIYWLKCSQFNVQDSHTQRWWVTPGEHDHEIPGHVARQHGYEFICFVVLRFEIVEENCAGAGILQIQAQAPEPRQHVLVDRAS